MLNLKQVAIVLSYRGIIFPWRIFQKWSFNHAYKSIDSTDAVNEEYEIITGNMEEQGSLLSIKEYSTKKNDCNVINRQSIRILRLF